MARLKRNRGPHADDVNDDSGTNASRRIDMRQLRPLSARKLGFVYYDRRLKPNVSKIAMLCSETKVLCPTLHVDTQDE